MKTSWQTLFATVLALAVSFTLHAQTRDSAQATNTSGKVTVTGCVERADQMSGAAAATTVDSLSFVLIHAAKADRADAPKGTTGTPSSAAKDTTYRLAGDMSKLNPHVGHKVEVTGTLDAAAAKPAGASADASSPSSAPRLTVVSLKMLAETCAR